jgi:hypothetical protein
MFRFKQTIVLVSLCFLSIFQPLHVQAAMVSSTVPIDSWVYPALEKLSGYGLLPSSLAGTRPYSRYEVARLVKEARRSEEQTDIPVSVAGVLDRLKTEFSDTLTDMDGGSPTNYVKARKVQLKFISQNGEDSTTAGAGVDAQQFSLNYNNNGLNYQDHNVQLTFQGEALLGRYVLIETRPLLLLQDGGNSETDLRLLDGRVAIQLGAFELSAGRQSLWWGQGRHGSMLLSNNAKPQDMIRLTNPSPVLLPWIFKAMGPIRFDVFWSRLDDERVVSEPYFAGLRVNFKPLPWVELGASRTIMFGGEGRPDVDLDEFVTILGGKNLAGDEDSSNSIASIDARIRLPFLYGAEFYGEYGGEDEAGHFLAAAAWQAGVYLPRIESSGRLSLRFEYADLSKIDNWAPAWYRHGIYRSGYTYEGMLIGHHVGGAGRDLYAGLHCQCTTNLAITMAFNYEKRSVDEDYPEEHNEISLSIDWQFSNHYGTEINLAHDRIDNSDYVSGRTGKNDLFSIGFYGRW